VNATDTTGTIKLTEAIMKSRTKRTISGERPITPACPGSASSIGVADEIHLAAGVASFQMVVPGEIFPVGPLTRREDTGSSADRTGAVQSGQDRLPDEGGPVGNALHRLEEFLIGLEGDYLVFGFHGYRLCTICRCPALSL
jgi:hypothetical protein